MKLIGINYSGGVRSLGRRDINAPERRRAGWEKGIGDVVESFGDIAEAMSEAEEKTIWAQRVLEDKFTVNNVHAYLKNNKTIDWDNPELPAFLEEIKGDRSGVQQSYEVMDEAIMYVTQSVYQNSLEALGEDPESVEKYQKAIDDTLAAKSSEILGLKYQWQSEHVEKVGERQFQEMIDDLDEQGAIRIAQNNRETGIWDQETFNDRIKEMGETIDMMSVDKSIRTAKTNSELDDLELELLEGSLRLSDEDRRTLLKQIDSTREDLEQDNTQWHDANYAKLMRAYGKGELTAEMVDAALANGSIDPDKAPLLFEKAKNSRNYVYMETDPQVKSALEGMVAKIPFTGNGTETVTDRGRRAQNKLNELYEADQISGEDYAELSARIDSKVQTALQNSPDYNRAVKLINTYTNYTALDLEAFKDAWRGDQKDMQIRASEANKEANSAFISALHDYMNHAGADADVVDWVNNNRDTFDPEKYKKASEERFLDAFPKYRNTDWGTDPKNREAGVNADRIVNDLGQRLRNNDLKAWQVKHALRMLGRNTEEVGL